MSVNKVILIGRLGAKPELRNTPSGAAVANFNMATNESWVDKNNQKQERTEWHRVVVWGRLAQLCMDYLDKGRQVYLEGRLQTRQWQDKDGATKYTTEVVASTVQFLGDRASAGASAGAGASRTTWNNAPGASAGGFGGESYGSAGAPGAHAGFAPTGGGLSLDEPSFTEEDIPF